MTAGVHGRELEALAFLAEVVAIAGEVEAGVGSGEAGERVGGLQLEFDEASELVLIAGEGGGGGILSSSSRRNSWAKRAMDWRADFSRSEGMRRLRRDLLAASSVRDLRNFFQSRSGGLPRRRRWGP